MRSVFPNVWIGNADDGRNLVEIHRAGISRSPTIVAASLATMKSISLEEALIQIAQSGPCDVSPALLVDVAQTIRRTLE